MKGTNQTGHHYLLHPTHQPCNFDPIRNDMPLRLFHAIPFLPLRSMWRPSATSRASWTTTSLRATRTLCPRRGGGTASWWTVSVPWPRTAVPTTARWDGRPSLLLIYLLVMSRWDGEIRDVCSRLQTAISYHIYLFKCHIYLAVF